MSAPASAKHLCWSYDDRHEFEARARDFLGAGLAAGEQVWYATAGGPGGLTGWLEEEGRARPGAVRFVPLEAAYRSGALVDPPAQVAEYVAATAAAVADGHAGLRVVVDVTPLVRTPAQFNAFARYEALVDRHITAAPMRAVCALDRGALGDRAVAELACLHPATNVDGARFSLRAGPPGGPAATLAGDLDITADELLPAALAHVLPRPVDGRIVIDARDLRFVDHRALLHLQRYAEDSAAVAVLHTSLSTVGRLLDCLGAARVRVEGKG
ncbi:MEDS domain-containing protein [Dactylosporangium sp. CA-139066]|uniref:MEDS domain-containing protein n=1 Tax=Dactylosporangium sp. CA-139066 TaxID=3239930 RepID=UPI003D8EF5C4